MRLNEKSIADAAKWTSAGFELPEYDRRTMIAKTRKEPIWVHFGAGNLFRAYPAVLQNDLLNRGLSDRGIIVVDNRDMVEKLLRAHDDLSLTVFLSERGSARKVVVGSIAEAVCLQEELSRLRKIFEKPSLQFASFTIAEKDYRLRDEYGAYDDDTAHDRMAGPEFCVSYMGVIAALLYRRFVAGAYPLAMVSLDNGAHNGNVLQRAVMDFAEAWELSGMCRVGFCNYLSDPSRVSFPLSMIDKITPRPDPIIGEMLSECGFEDVDGFVSLRGTYVAPYVNAEEAQYLVIEDAFPNGKPPLEDVGVCFADRHTVEKAERMKVCTCLNPLHTALAVFGCLMGFTRISEEMRDPDLRALAELIGRKEGLPVVDDPGILVPEAFLNEVLERRFPNPTLLDTPQRVAVNTSQKMTMRFGETVKTYLHTPGLRAAELTGIPLVIAAWCRYLMGLDDNAEPFSLSSDPMLDTLIPLLKDVRLGVRSDWRRVLEPILTRMSIFGVDLYAAGLNEKIERDFADMCAGKGAVRRTLHERVNREHI